MSRMTGRTRVVIGGVDTHADTHEAAVLDGRGRLLAVKKFVTTDQGIRAIVQAGRVATPSSSRGLLLLRGNLSADKNRARAGRGRGRHCHPS
jgi:hypothetical protein